MVCAMWLYANPALEHHHFPLKLGVEQVLHPSQLIYVDEKHDSPTAFARWTVEASNLVEEKEGGGSS